MARHVSTRPCRSPGVAPECDPDDPEDVALTRQDRGAQGRATRQAIDARRRADSRFRRALDGEGRGRASGLSQNRRRPAAAPPLAGHAPTTAVGPEQADKKADQDGQLAEVRLSISPAQHVLGAQFLTRWTQIEITEINGLTEARVAGNLHVRNLDDDLIARLKRRAARQGRSTEAEHWEILRQVLAGEHEPSFEKLAADLRKLTKRRKQTPSEILLREGRDER